MDEAPSNIDSDRDELLLPGTAKAAGVRNLAAFKREQLRVIDAAGQLVERRSRAVAPDLARLRIRLPGGDAITGFDQALRELERARAYVRAAELRIGQRSDFMLSQTRPTPNLPLPTRHGSWRDRHSRRRDSHATSPAQSSIFEPLRSPVVASHLLGRR
ncbi:hypothetical protein [Solirubrobacter soli]|uniref:hypothetical protein n=1 Tax=Solirubrobacter soli TaxID=363832 RepID=UPI0012FB6753|nr:hypothetical protein [Solirubrobacter soli]